MADGSRLEVLIVRLAEFERLRREGPTLKNVGENMRTIMVMVAMFVAVGILFRQPNPFMKALAVLWGVWSMVYMLLTAIQAGFLFAAALFEFSGFRKLFDASKPAQSVITNVFSLLVLMFMLTAMLVISANLSLVNRP